jgi:myo-inositol-1(or 4)-monophosphatase
MSQRPEEDRLDLADELAREAGELLLGFQSQGFEISKKGRVNLVTEADLAAERFIVEGIQKAFPNDEILAEEGGGSGAAAGGAPAKWIIDPLDGTTNYAHGYPCFCVSIGIEMEGRMVAGVVYDPNRADCFMAVRGGGAELNGRRIQVSRQEALVDSLLCTGFSYGDDEIARNLELFNRVMLKARSVRRDGSAALDLCYVACGRFDGFWELSLHPWDVAAGSLIVEEAGGWVSRFDGRSVAIYDRECLATNGRIHGTLAELLRG